MERTKINQIPQNIGKEISVKGFVQAIRDQGNIKFIILRDITGTTQIVVLKSSEALKTVDDLTLESVVEIIGTAKEEKQAPGGIEVSADKINILSKAQPELPIPVVVEKGGEETDVSKRFDWRWLDLRKSDKAQIFKVWNAMEQGFRDYYNANEFTQIYTPSFMSTASESGAEVFEVKYFDRPAYLAQSPQFYKQMAMSAGFEKVFVVGPVFRAEPSFTTRHMTEFTGWDFEISYIESHHDVMNELENVLVSGFTKVKEAIEDLEIQIPQKPFAKLTMKEAKQKLEEKGIEGPEKEDLSPEEEREICEIVKEETGEDFVFIIDYSIDVRPFYHMRYEENPALTKSFDLLYRGVEVVTGAQREHRIDVLEKQAKEKGMSLESLSDYLNFFRYGCPPHGGVGIGPARIIMKLLDLSSVKEATYLPRDVKRITP